VIVHPSNYLNKYVQTIHAREFNLFKLGFGLQKTSHSPMKMYKRVTFEVTKIF
jgi:hypothetical protein